MPFYQKSGRIPHKRHTTFRKSDGSLYHEELFGTIGFDGMSTLLYHEHPPTMVKEVLESTDVAPKIAVDKNMKAYRLEGFKVAPNADYLASRVPVLTNADLTISLAAPSASMVVVLLQKCTERRTGLRPRRVRVRCTRKWASWTLVPATTCSFLAE